MNKLEKNALIFSLIATTYPELRKKVSDVIPDFDAKKTHDVIFSTKVFESKLASDEALEELLLDSYRVLQKKFK